MHLTTAGTGASGESVLALVRVAEIAARKLQSLWPERHSIAGDLAVEAMSNEGIEKVPKPLRKAPRFLGNEMPGAERLS